MQEALPLVHSHSIDEVEEEEEIVDRDGQSSILHASSFSLFIELADCEEDSFSEHNCRKLC